MWENLGGEVVKLGLEDSIIGVHLTYLRGLFSRCWRKGHLLPCANHRYFLCVHLRQSPRAALAPDTVTVLEIVGKADVNRGASEAAVLAASLSPAARVATVW